MLEQRNESAKPKGLQELNQLADQIGDFIHHWGFKKIYGRIWTHVYLAKDPVDATTLRKRLGVSKALISLSLQDLLNLDVLVDAGKNSRGNRIYKANPDLVEGILRTLEYREKKLIAAVDAGFRQVRQLRDEDKEFLKISDERMIQMEDFIQEGHKILDQILNLETVDFSRWNRFRSRH